MTDPAPPLFEPSAASGAALRRTIASSLADSFEHIFEASRGHLSFAKADTDAFLARLRSGGLERPVLYSRHFHLVDAIEDDDLDKAQTILNAILAATPGDRDIVISAPAEGRFAGDAEAILPFFTAEEDSRYVFVDPDPAATARSAREMGDALELLRRTAPGLAAETDEIVRWIMLVEGKVRPEYEGEGYPFGSSSALRAWGAITVNADTKTEIFNRAVTIVHEAAHDVLFALAPKEGVVTNADNERYGSPLRADLRPLEGIYHATFVVARIDLAARTMLESGRLEGAQEALARRHLENEDLFYDGLATLERHADFTEIGRSALASAETYMRSHAA